MATFYGSITPPNFSASLFANSTGDSFNSMSQSKQSLKIRSGLSLISIIIGIILLSYGSFSSKGISFYPGSLSPYM